MSLSEKDVPPPTVADDFVLPEGVRPWDDLRASGLLWLINATVFHPRGLALAFVMRNSEPVGWKLLGDGTEVWAFGTDGLDAVYGRAQVTLSAATNVLRDES